MQPRVGGLQPDGSSVYVLKHTQKVGLQLPTNRVFLLNYKRYAAAAAKLLQTQE